MERKELQRLKETNEALAEIQKTNEELKDRIVKLEKAKVANGTTTIKQHEAKNIDSEW